MYIRNRRQDAVLRVCASITLLAFLPSSVQAWNFLPTVTREITLSAPPEPALAPLPEARVEQLRFASQVNNAPTTFSPATLRGKTRADKGEELGADLLLNGTLLAKLEALGVYENSKSSNSFTEPAATHTDNEHLDLVDEPLFTSDPKRRLAVARLLTTASSGTEPHRLEGLQLAQVRTVQGSSPQSSAAQTTQPPNDASAVLENADNALASGELPDAIVGYLEVVERFPDSSEAVLAGASLEDFVYDARTGRWVPGQIARVTQRLPDVDMIHTGLGRAHLLGVLRACGDAAMAAGDRHNAGRYFASVRDAALNYLGEEPDSPYQLPYMRAYVEASNAIGPDKRLEATTRLWEIVREQSANDMTLFAARSELAMELFRRGERVECGLQFADLREGYAASSAEAWALDGQVDAFARAHIELSRAYADFQLSFFHAAAERFLRIANEYKAVRDASETAGYLAALATHLGNQADIAIGARAFEDYVLSTPGSALLDKALFHWATILHHARDFQGASDVYLMVIQARPESDLAGFARLARKDMIERGELVDTGIAAQLREAGTPENWCGPSALAQLLSLQGVETNVAELAQQLDLAVAGSTLAELQELAARLGVALRGIRAEDSEALIPPYIAYVANEHYVLVDDSDGSTVFFRETDGTGHLAARDAFSERWTGMALIPDRPSHERLAALTDAEMKSFRGGQGTFSDSFNIAGPESENCENQNDPPPPSCSSRGFAGGGAGGGEGGQQPLNLAGGMNLGPGSPIGNGIGTGPLNAGEQAGLGLSGTALRGQQVSVQHLGVETRGTLSASFSLHYANPWGFHRPYFEDASKPYKRNIGNSWTHAFNAHVRSSSTLESLYYVDETGNALYFVEEPGLETGSEVFYFKVENETPRAQRALYFVRAKSDDSYQLFWPDGRVYGFSSPIGSTERYSRLETVRDASYENSLGNEIVLEYQPLGTSPDFGRLTKVGMPDGDDRYFQIAYSSGLISTVSLKLSTSTLRYVAYQYDGSGMLTKATWDGDTDTAISYAYGSEQHPDYPSNPSVGKWISAVTDRNANTTSVTQEYTTIAFGWWMPTKTVFAHPGGNETHFERPVSGAINRTMVRNYEGSTAVSKLEYEIDYKSYNLTGVRYYKDPVDTWAGSDYWPIDYQYSADFWAPTRVRTPSGTAYAEYRYNDAGRMLSKKVAGKPWAYYEYPSSSAMHPTKFVSSDGLETTYEYDAKGRVITVKPPHLGTSGIAYTYDDYGQVITMTNSLGHHTRMEYDARGQVTKRIAPDSTFVRMAYNDLGQVVSMFDEYDEETEYEYEGGCGACGSGSGHLTKVINAAGHATTMVYDEGGRLVEQIDALSRSTEYEYDDDGRLTRVVDPSGEFTTMEYDGLGRLTRTIPPVGAATTVHYDYMGRLISQDDGAGTTEYTYTAYGSVSTVTDGNSNVWTYDHTAYNELTRATDPEGKRTFYSYDLAGRSTKVAAGFFGTVQPTEYFYDGTTGLLGEVRYTSADYGVNTAKYFYDNQARLVQLDDWMGGAGNDGHFFEYDLMGRVTRYRDFDDDPGGTRQKVDYTYDLAGRLSTMTDYDGYTTTYTYTALGQVSTITAPGSKTWTFTYNALGQRTQATLPNGMTTHYSYDGANRLTKLEHKDGATVVDGWSYGLDRDGGLLRVASAVAGDAQAWDYHHDDRGRLVNAVHRNGAGKPTYRHAYDYDAGDNLLTRRKVVYENVLVDDFSDNDYTNNPTWTPTFTWSASGGFLTNVDALGIIKTPMTEGDTEGWFSYRLANTNDFLLVSVRRGSGGTENVNLLLKTNELALRNNSTTLASTTDAADVPGAATPHDVYYRVVGSQLDLWHGPQGGPLRHVLSTDAAATFTNTHFEIGAAGAGNRIDNIRVVKARTGARSFTDDFSDGNYTANPAWGNSGDWSATNLYMENTTQTGTNQFFRNINHDDAEFRFRYTLSSASSNGNPRLSFRFRADYAADTWLLLNLYKNSVTLQERHSGSFHTIASNGSGGSALDTAYDLTLVADGGRIEVWRSSGGGDATLLLSATPTHAFAGTQHGWLAYAGNMVRVDDIDFRYPDPVLETFAYNDANELTSQVVNGVSTSFTYDDWGRMVTKTQGGYTAAYRYRYGDKLKRIDTDFPGESALPVDFLYDGLGRRRLVAMDLVNVSWHRYDLGWNVLGDYAAGGGSWGVGARVNSYQWHGMTPLAETPGANPGTGATRHHLHDHLGSTRALFDGSKARLARLDYEPHGQPTHALGAAANRSFTGKQYDAGIGMYHFPYRHYSPSHARWMTRDPLGMVDGPNVYAYVRGAAVTAVDPLGLWIQLPTPCDIICGLACGLGAMAVCWATNCGAIVCFVGGTIGCTTLCKNICNGDDDDCECKPPPSKPTMCTGRIWMRADGSCWCHNKYGFEVRVACPK